MRPLTSQVQVVLAPDGFSPQLIRWEGSSVRVLSVEAFRTTGLRRRFQVRTLDGPYELELHVGTGAWAISRRPGWLARVRAILAAQPRYPLPAGRRRARLPVTARPASVSAPASGGSHAGRLALVRQ